MANEPKGSAVVTYQRRHQVRKLGLGNTCQLGLEQPGKDARTAQHGRAGVFVLDGHQHLHDLVNRDGVLDAVLSHWGAWRAVPVAIGRDRWTGGGIGHPYLTTLR